MYYEGPDPIGFFKFLEDGGSKKVRKVIDEHGGVAPHGISTRLHPSAQLALWTGAVAGSIPLAMFNACKRGGLVDIPEGVLKGVCATVGWSLYLPTFIVLTLAELPLALSNDTAKHKEEYEVKMIKTLYSMSDMCEKLVKCKKIFNFPSDV